MTIQKQTLKERFDAKWTPEPNSGCWLWTACTLRTGYGNLERRGAHRISWELYRGPIPLGLYVCHRCDTPPCVNPNHLFLATHADNMRDAMAKGRWLGKDYFRDKKRGIRVCDAAAYWLRKTDNPAVGHGDTHLLHEIATVMGWKHASWKTELRVLNALSRTPGELIPTYFRHYRLCRNFYLPEKCPEHLRPQEEKTT